MEYRFSAFARNHSGSEMRAVGGQCGCEARQFRSAPSPNRKRDLERNDRNPCQPISNSFPAGNLGSRTGIGKRRNGHSGGPFCVGPGTIVDHFYPSMRSGFIDKLIERIRRIQPEEGQNYLGRLAQEKGFLERIFDALQEGVIVTDTQGKLQFINAAAAQIFLIDPDESIGEPLQEKLQGIDWISLRSSARTVSRDIEISYPQHRFLNFYVAPLHLDKELGSIETTKQDLVGYAIILRDITEDRRMAEKTIESERLSALTLLAAGVAHEIGNPLNSLNIHLQLIEKK